MAIDRRELRQLLPALRRYARGLGGEMAADDLVQDCLLLALDREAQYRGPRLAPWLYAILTNLARSRHRTRLRAAPIEEMPELADAGTDPEMRMTLTAALASLPTEQRAALLLSAVEGFTYEETATIMAVPVGTVMSRIWRARTALAARLAGAEIVTLRSVK